MDILALRLMLALTGPTPEGSRQRTFLTPLHAFCSVEHHQPLHRYVDLDASGYLKPPGPVAEQSFLVVSVLGGEDHLTSTVMTGDEVMGQLRQIESQALIAPVTRVAHSVVRACRDLIMKPKAEHVRAVAQLAISMAPATAEDGR